MNESASWCKPPLKTDQFVDTLAAKLRYSGKLTSSSLIVRINRSGAGQTRIVQLVGAAGISRTVFALQHFEDDYGFERGGVLALIGGHDLAPLLDSLYSLLSVQF